MLYGEAFLGLWLLKFSLVLTAEDSVKNALQDKIPIPFFWILSIIQKLHLILPKHPLEPT